MWKIKKYNDIVRCPLPLPIALNIFNHGTSKFEQYLDLPMIPESVLRSTNDT